MRILETTDRNAVPDFARVASDKWEDWHWQKRNSVMIYPTTGKTLKEHGLETLLHWTSNDPMVKQITPELLDMWAINISPHLALQLARLEQAGMHEWRQQLMRFVLPLPERTTPASIQFKREGIGTEERRHTAYESLPWGMSRLYDDRVIVKASTICPVACQFCFRQHDVAEHHELESKVRGDMDNAIEYVRDWNKSHQDRQIRDVILSGGDPLSLSDERLYKILTAFKAIEGVQMLRIDSKYPAVLPQRITIDLVAMIKEFRPMMVIHFTHPGELCPEVKEACDRLADAGMMLGSHTPLLRGVNDDRQTLITLFWNLFLMRVRPLYLINSIQTPGTEHLQVSVDRGVELIDHLEAELAGPAQPQYILYTTNGGGKVRILPQNLKERRPDGWIVNTWKGEDFYPDPR